eukprot:2269582-Ditylum_brightwellii.AAC.1
MPETSPPHMRSSCWRAGFVIEMRALSDKGMCLFFKGMWETVVGTSAVTIGTSEIGMRTLEFWLGGTGMSLSPKDIPFNKFKPVDCCKTKLVDCCICSEDGSLLLPV